MSIQLSVNGRRIEADPAPRMHLADFLREELLLTATHLGCEHGVCGACTVLINGAPARSCITFAAALDGAEITTVEGLENDAIMTDLRRSFSAHHALQCGFCTPGMMVTARDIAIRFPGAAPERVRLELAGNLCRCTGYVGIVRAIQDTSAKNWPAPSAEPQQAIAEARTIAATLPTETRQTVAAQAANIAKPSSVGQTRIEQSFIVPFPRAVVWDFFQNPAKVVSCLPGAALTAPSNGKSIQGEFTARLGPMKASFSGEGTIVTDPIKWTGEIEGRATDRGSATRGRGRLEYHLLDGGDGDSQTEVRVAVEYSLTGPLAQISRGGIARDLANRLTIAFADNLRLSLQGRTVEAAELKAGSLILASIGSWLRSLIGRVGIVRVIQDGSGNGRPAPSAQPATPSAEPRQVLPDVRTIAVTLPTETRETVTAPTANIAKPSSAGQTRIEQSFTVPFPRAVVWDFFQNPAKVVSCLPGAALTAPSNGKSIQGEFTARLGPMKASFSGEGTIVTDPIKWTGEIEGRATDRGSATRGRGRLEYHLLDGVDGQTEIRVAVEYSLTGPLAQISRGGIARDLANRLTIAFADNLRLSLQGQTVEAAELKAGSLILASIGSWLRSLWHGK